MATAPRVQGPRRRRHPWQGKSHHPRHPSIPRHSLKGTEMNLLAQLLPKFVSDLPATARKAVYGALVILGALLLADYKFATGSGLPWIDAHVVSAATLAWFTAIVTPILVMAHQKVDLPQ